MIAYTTYIHDGRVKRHAEALRYRGDTVDVICLAEERTDTSGVRLFGIKMPRYRGGRHASYLRSYARFFCRAAKKAIVESLGAPYDLVIVCTMPDVAILAALPCRVFGSRLMLDFHDTMPELYLDKFRGKLSKIGARLLMIGERLCAALADRVLAVHDLHAERLRIAGIPTSKITVVINAPDPRIFLRQVSMDCASAASNRDVRSGGLAEWPFTLICHGTIARRLGLDTAIRAVALIKDQFDLKLRILGVGDYLDQLKSLSTELGLESKVSFEPPVAIDQLPKIISEADVGLIPNHATEATHLMLPVKLLEYAALGIPVIGARLRTVEHYFGDSVRYFEPGDVEELARAIAELYRNPAQRRLLGMRAAEVVARLSWPVQQKRYFEAVDSLLAQREEALCEET
jgi:glycosyltransferase involved in cell wall biosynthesis